MMPETRNTPAGETLPRRFLLVRERDVTGVSGTGVVAFGVCWPDGGVVLHWRTGRASTAVYTSVADVEAVHGHEGATTIDWVD